MNTKAKRAAILTRVSTEEQVDGTSLGDQARLCQSLIESRGWEFTGKVYEDAGISGTVENRPALTEALRDAARGEFDVLVALNLSRLARKLYISAKVIDDLAELDVAFVSVQEAFIDTSSSAGRGVAGMFSSIAQMDRDSIVEKTARGQRAKGHAGLWPGGHPPFGWRLEGFKRTAHPVPDEREREVLAEAYRLLVTKRLNAFQVAARLNDAGLGPRKAREWNPESLRRVLANKTLATGVVIWGAPSQGQGGYLQRSHKTKVKRDGTPKWGDPIRIELPEPPLTPAQHKAIMRALASRSNRDKVASPVSRPLTGQVFGACGESYYGVTIKGKAPVMRCTGRRHLLGDAKCSCKQVAWEPLEARVWAAVSALLSDPARLEAMARQYLELPAEAGDGSQDATLLAAVERQIAKLETAQANAARELIRTDNPAPIRAALAEVERDLAGLRERREGYRALAASVQEQGEALRDLAALAERARGNLARMTEEQRREVYRILRVRVQMTGEIVSGADRVARPDGLVVSGVIDPRMWGGGDSSDGNGHGGVGPQPRFPAPSGGTTPSTPTNGEDRRDRVFGGGGAGLVGQQCRRPATGEGGEGVHVFLLSSWSPAGSRGSGAGHEGRRREHAEDQRCDAEEQEGGERAGAERQQEARGERRRPHTPLDARTVALVGGRGAEQFARGHSRRLREREDPVGAGSRVGACRLGDEPASAVDRGASGERDRQQLGVQSRGARPGLGPTQQRPRPAAGEEDEAETGPGAQRPRQGRDHDAEGVEAEGESEEEPRRRQPQHEAGGAGGFGERHADVVGCRRGILQRFGQGAQHLRQGCPDRRGHLPGGGEIAPFLPFGGDRLGEPLTAVDPPHDPRGDLLARLGQVPPCALR